MHTDYVGHTPTLAASMRLVSVHGKIKLFSAGTLRPPGLLERATPSNICRKTIGLSKLCPDSTLCHKVAERRGILLLLHMTVSCQPNGLALLNGRARSQYRRGVIQ